MNFWTFESEVEQNLVFSHLICRKGITQCVFMLAFGLKSCLFRDTRGFLKKYALSKKSTSLLHEETSFIYLSLKITGMTEEFWGKYSENANFKQNITLNERKIDQWFVGQTVLEYFTDFHVLYSNFSQAFFLCWLLALPYSMPLSS